MEQIYAGEVDLKTIKRIKEKANIPIIANGGIFSLEDANRVFTETNVDGIMLARGVIGNPYLINEILISKKSFIANKEKIKVLEEHFNLLKALKGEKIASREIRKFICYYTKGFSKAKSIREQIATVVDDESLKNLINQLDLDN